MNKYGIEHFYIEEIEKCDDTIASERETYWIGYYHSYTDGYNATLGGDGKNFYNYKEILDLIIQQYSISEICEKIGCCRDIVYQVAKNNNITLLSPQQVAAERLSKKVEQFSKDMVYIQSFNSVADASRWLFDNEKISKLSSGVRGHISEVCNEKRKTAYGYIWKYSE